MADPDSNSPEYREILRLLVLLNSSVRFITLHLKELASSKMLSPDYLNRLAAATEEVHRYLGDADTN
jgi:hypothetical protein